MQHVEWSRYDRKMDRFSTRRRAVRIVRSAFSFILLAHITHRHAHMLNFKRLANFREKYHYDAMVSQSVSVFTQERFRSSPFVFY